MPPASQIDKCQFFFFLILPLFRHLVSYCSMNPLLEDSFQGILFGVHFELMPHPFKKNYIKNIFHMHLTSFLLPGPQYLSSEF